MFVIKSDDQRHKTVKRIEGLQSHLRSGAEKYGKEKGDLIAKGIKHHLFELREQVRIYDDLRSGGTKPLKPQHLSEIGPYLVSARIASGMTQSELAEKIGVSQPMVHKYEDFEFQGVGIDVLAKAIKALGVSVNLEAFQQQGITRYDSKRQAEAILFFGDRINNTNLGKTKLMKLLYYTDYEWAKIQGVSITGDKYVAMPYGPVPKHAKEILGKLEESGAIQIKKCKAGTYDQERYFVLRRPDLSVFTAEEITHLDGIARRFEFWTAKQMTDLSHEDWPWQSTPIGEEIRLL